jgi:type I restriction enzyme, S subunit
LKKWLAVPLPDPDEQRRIAAALKLADDAIAKTKAELEATRELKRSLMQTLFVSGMPGRHSEFVEMKIGRVSKGWEIKH